MEQREWYFSLTKKNIDKKCHNGSNMGVKYRSKINEINVQKTHGNS